MKIIAYCDECTDCFLHWPTFYTKLFEDIVEEFVMYQRFYPLLSDAEAIYTHDFITRLEAAGFLLTREATKELLWARPTCLHYLDTAPDSTEIYQVCLDITKHRKYSYEESVDD